MSRLVGLDIGRGIGILGVVFSHSYMGRICGWSDKILFDLINKLPIIILITLAIPIILCSLLGSLFSFITAICVTISVLKIRNKGMNWVWKYIFMKVIFAIILKGMEDVYSNFLNNYNMFRDGKLVFPEINLTYASHTLDDVGFFSWAVPLCVIAVGKLTSNYRYQMAILVVAAVLMIQFNEFTMSIFTWLANWSNEKEWYLMYFLCKKIYDGHYSLVQYFPFGLFGGAYGILFTHTKDFKTYWRFTWILCGVCLILGIQIVLADDIISKLFVWVKPVGYLYLVNIPQCLGAVLFMHLADNPERPLLKRYKFVKWSTFLRRANTTSLSAYLLEAWFSQRILVFFQAFFGPGSDRVQEKTLWSWPLVVVYMLTTVVLWFIFLKYWEKVDFKYSAENQMGCILGWLFNQPYNKTNVRENVYKPSEDLLNALLESNTIIEGESIVIDTVEKPKEETVVQRQ